MDRRQSFATFEICWIARRQESPRSRTRREESGGYARSPKILAQLKGKGFGTRENVHKSTQVLRLIDFVNYWNPGRNQFWNFAWGKNRRAQDVPIFTARWTAVFTLALILR